MQQLSPLHEIIEELIKQLGENYVFPEKVPEIATCLRQQFEQGIYDDVRDGEILAQMITEQLRTVSHDKHLRLIYQANGVSIRMDDNEAYTSEEIERIRQKKQQNYGLKKVEILDCNIGYFQLNTFVHPNVAGESMR